MLSTIYLIRVELRRCLLVFGPSLDGDSIVAPAYMNQNHTCFFGDMDHLKEEIS